MKESFLAILEEKIGLDINSIGTKTVERAIQRCISTSGESSYDSYVSKLSNSETEWQNLIDAIVVPETWFYRDSKALIAVAQVLQEEWISHLGIPQVHLMSAACSTGEEPYSMAMVLFEAGFDPRQFRIDAIDISADALDWAKRGIYRKKSFRGFNPELLARYFTSCSDGMQINDNVKHQVTFRLENLIHPQGLPKDYYQAIFCRNVLIYFTRPNQELVVRHLRQALKERGMLVVGPAESGVLLSSSFTSIRKNSAMLFRRENPILHGGSRASLSAKRHTLPTVVKSIKPLEAHNDSKLSLPKTPIPQQIAPVPRPWYVVAREYADNGRMAEAERLCLTELEKNRSSGEGYFLLGLIKDASGDSTSAETMYRKAIYWEPEHVEALQHLALLLERQGDLPTAKVMRIRAERIVSGAPKEERLDRL